MIFCMNPPSGETFVRNRPGASPQALPDRMIVRESRDRPIRPSDYVADRAADPPTLP